MSFNGSVLFIRDSPITVGGVEMQIIRTSLGLQKRGIKTFLATSDKDSNFSKKFAETGGKVHQVKLGRQYSLLASVEEIVTLITKENCAIVQTHLFRESLIGRAVKRKVPSVKHVFRAETYIDCSWIPSYRKFLYHVLDRVSAHYVDVYVANGEVLAKELTGKSWISRRKISVLLNGCEPLGEPDAGPVDKTSPLSPRVAMVSNLIPKKGHDVLVKALSILKGEGLIIYAKLIGGELNTGSSFKREIIKAAEETSVLSQLEFMGFTKDVKTALEDHYVVVLPSDSEGTPNSILEAMSMRKLVIVSKVGGVPEMVEDNVSGLLHPPQDPKSFAALLRRVFTTPASQWESMRDAGYNRWKHNFTVDKMIDELVVIYNRLANGKEE